MAHPKVDIESCRVPRTQLSFVNVPIVPAATRSGQMRYLSATWGGAFYVFDRNGQSVVFPLPEGTQGTYSFAPATEPGFAWVVFTGGKVAQVDLDAGQIAFIADVPLKIINWSAVVTKDGLLVCSATPGDVMVYDTRRREVKAMITPVSKTNHYGKFLQAAPDGTVIIPMMVPGAELIRLDPRNGQTATVDVSRLTGKSNFLPPASTLTPQGLYAVPQPDHVALLSWPDFQPAGSLPYPDSRGEWKTFRDEKTRRLFASRGEDEPLYALNDRGQWEARLRRFPRQCGRAVFETMFAELPEGGMLALSQFGEIGEYSPDGSLRLVAELDNYGHPRVCALAPASGTRVFTTTFINSSFQELDMATGEGRNFRPCQKHGGQASTALWFRDTLWLGCYGGAEITRYEPERGGEWPENPRPFADIGHEQMRPVGLCGEGRHLWIATHAGYGKYDGALARVDTESGACKVWRGQIPGHNPTSIVLDAATRRIYGGTTVWPDCNSAPPAPGPAGLYAFDIDKEEVVWTARPAPDAESVHVSAVFKEMVLARVNDRLFQISADTGSVAGSREAGPELSSPGAVLFLGADGSLYLASQNGLFSYDLETGATEKILNGPVSLPRVRGQDLLFIRGDTVCIARDFWAA